MSDDERGLITQTFPFGDGAREVSVWVPQRPVEALLVCGDGQLLVPWGADLEAADLEGDDLEADDLPATMVVGVHRLEDEWARIHEYSPGFELAIFEAHERFLLDEVMPWVGQRFGVDVGRDRTAVWGVSASAELALALGLRHSEVFGTILAASPGGGYQPPGDLDRALAAVAGLPKAYLLAGSDEPWFAENADRWAAALREAGGHVEQVVRAGDHGDPFWREELATMVRWSFGWSSKERSA